MTSASKTPPGGGGSYVCDTLPAPRLAPESSKPLPVHHTAEADDMESSTVVDKGTKVEQQAEETTSVAFAPAGRKLCVRHQRMADEGTNLKLQQVCTVKINSASDIFN